MSANGNGGTSGQLLLLLLGQGQLQHAALLGDVGDPGLGGGGPQQRHVQQRPDAPGQVAVAVQQFVRQVVGVLPGADRCGDGYPGL